MWSSLCWPLQSLRCYCRLKPIGGSEDPHMVVAVPWNSHTGWWLNPVLLSETACSVRGSHCSPCVTRRASNWRKGPMMWRSASPHSTREHAAARAPSICGTGTTRSSSLILMEPSPSTSVALLCCSPHPDDEYLKVIWISSQMMLTVVSSAQNFAHTCSSSFLLGPCVSTISSQSVPSINLTCR